MGAGSGAGVAVGVGIGVGSGAVSQARKAIRNTGKAIRVHRRCLPNVDINIDIDTYRRNKFTKSPSIIHSGGLVAHLASRTSMKRNPPHSITLERAILYQVERKAEGPFLRPFNGTQLEEGRNPPYGQSQDMAKEQKNPGADDL
jgi:hypothetical protein